MRIVSNSWHAFKLSKSFVKFSNLLEKESRFYSSEYLNSFNSLNVETIFVLIPSYFSFSDSFTSDTSFSLFLNRVFNSSANDRLLSQNSPCLILESVIFSDFSFSHFKILRTLLSPS